MKSLSFVAALLGCFLTVILADDYATYPQVPQTASINGFADPIYSLLPECAKSCVKVSTDNTPCPYWDTGCLCVMPQWSGLVAQCIADNCQGQEVVSATSLATSLCFSVGADTFMMPASISTALSTAAANVDLASVTDDTSVQGGNSEVISEISTNESSISSTETSFSNSQSSEETSSTPTSAAISSTTTASSSSSANTQTSSSSTANKAVTNSITSLWIIFIYLLPIIA